MELPINLKHIIEEKAEALDTKKLIAASRSITDKYKNESGKGKRLVSDIAETAAYSVVRMPATFGAVAAALTWTREHFDEEISTAMDIGAGTGAAGWAVSEVFPEAEKLTAVEREENMLALGKGFMEEGGFPMEYEWLKGDISSEMNYGSYDLVTASYVLNELEEAARERAVERLFSMTKKLLVIIEPGTMAGFNNIQKIRSQLIALGGYVVAPCPHSAECPIRNEDWCHFTARVSRTKLHKLLKGGDAPFEDEKFSYIAVSKAPIIPAQRRILRHPAIESGRIGLRLCTHKGIEDITVTKKDPLFKMARKADCGDEI